MQTATSTPSTSKPGIVLERRRGGVAELTVAWWTPGPHAQRGPVLISVTDFQVRRISDLLRVYYHGLRLGRAWPSLTGAVGMWMWTKPRRRRAGSVSVWREEADLRRFIRWTPHERVMRAYRNAGEITSTSWLETSFDASELWAKAAARLVGDDPELAHGGRAT
jgi:hypothetical protein